MIEQQINDLADTIGVRRSCAVLGVARPSFYRWRKPRDMESPDRREPKPQPRALTTIERQAILSTLADARFCDLSPMEIYAILLDEGTYLASISTYYRVLRQAEQIRERRRVATHPPTVKPALIASAPNQVWSWDITCLRGPEKWTWYYLYVILDIFSRYVVGWTIARQQTAAIAHELISDTMTRARIMPGTLTLHADRGGPMTAKPVAHLLADLGVTKSHSRPHVSDDNPFSEAQFKTLKYRPDFPTSFTSLGHAYRFSNDFFPWYNEQHRHSGIGLLTPAMVHHGEVEVVRNARRAVLLSAYEKHPERFVRKAPEPPAIAAVTYINPPEYDSLIA